MCKKRTPKKGVLLSDESSFFPEVRKTETCGRKIAFLFAEDYHDKNRNGCKIWENLINCGMNERDLIIVRNYGKSADYKRTDNSLERAPGCKNNDCNGKPTVTAYAVMYPTPPVPFAVFITI